MDLFGIVGALFMPKLSGIHPPNIVVEATDYDEFLKENRKIINRYINTVLWFCVLTGPAIAVAFLHRIIMKKWPYSYYPGLAAFICMEALLIRKNRESKEYAERLHAQMDILFSMAEVYDYVNLIDFQSMTELSIKDREKAKPLGLGDHAHSLMNHHIKNDVDKEHFEDFWEFTNLKTLKNRLRGKRFIYGEFVNVKTGWFRAQYINIEEDENGFPSLIVYTVQNINVDKRREENLIKISHTDELTSIFNRRCLEYDLAKYKSAPLEADLVIGSVDINRLKRVNDTYGHAAGDELICGAADSLIEAVGHRGKVYRTGGDEFTLVMQTKDITSLNEEILKTVSSWTGSYGGKLEISIGYAAHADHPDLSVEELIRVADNLMYENKNEYYQKNGYDRRMKDS